MNMSHLIKKVCIRLLTNSLVSQTSFRLYSVSPTTLTEAPPRSTGRSPDLLMQAIRTAPTPTELLASVSRHVQVMNHKHMLQVLRTLFELHRDHRSEYEVEDILNNSTFGTLCHSFKRHARALETNEAVEAVKILSYLQVPPDSVIFQTILQLVRTNINDINIKQIMFLDFILSKYDINNHLIDALRLALPLVFQIHLPLELDHDDLPLSREMLTYACRHNLPDRIINNIVTGLILHDKAITAPVAKSVIWSLCEVNCRSEVYSTRVQLLHICFGVLSQSMDTLPYDEVLRTVAKIKRRILEKHMEYYHEGFLDAIAEYVVSKGLDFEKALLIARVLARIAHTNLTILEYLCDQAIDSTKTLSSARTNVLFSFVNCLANSNYKPSPEHWAEIRRQISLNPVLDAKSTALPWTKFCLELASLGHYEEKLLYKVFSEEFLRSYLAREESTLDYLQLLTLYEATRTFCPDWELRLPDDVLKKAQDLYPNHSHTQQVEECLARGLGGPEFLVRNVQLPSGIVTDSVVCLKDGYPLPLQGNEEGKTPLGLLNLPEKTSVVCIMKFNQGCYSLNGNRLRGTFRLIIDILEKQGYPVLPINISEWLSMPTHEHTPYMMREIGYKCEEFGVVLNT